jgi:dolichyl-phosphate-mannose--protein O-mannosyl transferase
MAQNFENHVKLVPAFHFFVLPVFLINLIWSIVRAVRSFSIESAFSVLLALAFLLLAFLARIFALTVQDRVIRLEMRLRMQQLLPQELRPRISDFTVDQLVSLRFASDAELPALAHKVLDEKLTDRKVIKKLIQNWQADFLRA